VEAAYSLQTKGVRKSFSGVEVLHGVDLDLMPGRVHAVVGENGAGKSTLIKILSGVYRRDGGVVLVGGSEVDTLSPQIAQGLGISTIYQERNLIPYLTVGENILLGDVPTGRFGGVRWHRLFELAAEILQNLRLDLDPHELVVNLSVAEQQAVEIAKALYKKALIVIMDEPTASLTAAEMENLFRLICQLKQENVAVIYISHRLDEIFEIADEVTVLRDGLKVLHADIEEIDKSELVRAMVGEELEQTLITGPRGGEVLLQAQSISRKGSFEDVSLSLQRSTIIGIAGSVGSGRTDVLRALAGLDRVSDGQIIHRGKDLTGQGLARFISQGICLVPSDRDHAGLILSMSVAGNTTLANLNAVRRGPLMDLRSERSIAELFMDKLNVPARSVAQEVQYLSGGNRQKVMLSKWLCLGLEVFLLDEPTQGVDVGAREEIHQIMKQLLDEGKGILMVTSDLDELMNMSHYIAVMAKGRVVAYLETENTSREEVLSYALGQRNEQVQCVTNA